MSESERMETVSVGQDELFDEREQNEKNVTPGADDFPEVATRDLTVMVNEAALPQTKSQQLLDQFSDLFAELGKIEAQARTIKVTDDAQVVEMKLARTLRLSLREKRIAIENTRKDMKSSLVREGKAIDGISNVLKAAIEPLEQYLDRQEHFTKYRIEREEQARRELAEQALREKEAAEAEERRKAHVQATMDRIADIVRGVIDHEPKPVSVLLFEVKERIIIDDRFSVDEAKAARDALETARKVIVDRKAKEDAAAEAERQRQEAEKAEADRIAAEERKKREAAEAKAKRERKRAREQAAAAEKKAAEERAEAERRAAEKARAEAEARAKLDREHRAEIEKAIDLIIDSSDAAAGGDLIDDIEAILPEGFTLTDDERGRLMAAVDRARKIIEEREAARKLAMVQCPHCGEVFDSREHHVEG